jgi:hypothetical protein
MRHPVRDILSERLIYLFHADQGDGFIVLLNNPVSFSSQSACQDFSSLATLRGLRE